MRRQVAIACALIVAALFSSAFACEPTAVCTAGDCRTGADPSEAGEASASNGSCPPQPYACNEHGCRVGDHCVAPCPPGESLCGMDGCSVNGSCLEGGGYTGCDVPRCKVRVGGYKGGTAYYCDCPAPADVADGGGDASSYVDAPSDGS
jgi:hypothetical protein